MENALVCPAMAAVARYGMGEADVVRRLLDIVAAVGQQASPLEWQAMVSPAEAIRSEWQEWSCPASDSL